MTATSPTASWTATGTSCPPKPLTKYPSEAPRPPPPVGEGRPAAFSEQEREFAAANHALIYSFLQDQALDEAEYYDIALFGYLHAVRRYLSHARLRRYRFSTIAWRAMRQSLNSFYRAEERRRAGERKYLEAHHDADPYLRLEAELLLHSLASISTEEQIALVRRRLQGLSIKETAQASGMTPKRASRLLKQLYHTYLSRSDTLGGDHQ